MRTPNGWWLNRGGDRSTIGKAHCRMVQELILLHCCWRHRLRTEISYRYCIQSSEKLIDRECEYNSSTVGLLCYVHIFSF